MAAIPQPRNTTATAVVQWRERTTVTGHRAHLGASVIGRPCERALWYTFRWVRAEKFDGRILRLFDTGKREEPRVYEELRGIGCEVHADDGGTQYRVSALGGFFGGAMDGVVSRLPEAPKAWHVLEIKTHSDKSFAEVVKKGVREAKPMHWAQMQTYMHLADIDRALYYAVNKNTDALHLERVERDRAEGARIMERAERVIRANAPPVRISDDPAWYECKLCPFRSVCHEGALPEVNCRTCAHATPDIDRGCWTCNDGSALSDPMQRTGCDAHLFIPPLLVALGEPVDGDDESVVYQTADGARFTNGRSPGFASREIVALGSVAALTDQVVQCLKTEFPTARVVGP